MKGSVRLSLVLWLGLNMLLLAPFFGIPAKVVGGRPFSEVRCTTFNFLEGIKIWRGCLIIQPAVNFWMHNIKEDLPAADSIFS
jgi:hypothetical protein